MGEGVDALTVVHRGRWGDQILSEIGLFPDWKWVRNYIQIHCKNFTDAKKMLNLASVFKIKSFDECVLLCRTIKVFHR